MNKIRAALVLFALLITAGVFGIKTTSSYFTDFDSALNPVTPGCNETEIIEEFPDTPPKNPEDDPVYEKTVRISAPSMGGANVAGYIRARILFSNSDLGKAVVLSGMNSAWVKEQDGYYYYTTPVKEGQTTAPLFTKVALDSSKISDNASKYVEDFSITIYEESIQAGKNQNYRDAWNCFVPAAA